MQKKYKKLWVFGDSFTSPGMCVEIQDSFWALVADRLQIPLIINCSRIGNSWTTIQHLVIGLNKKIDWVNDLVFVGIPPLERITVFDNFQDTPYTGSIIDTSLWSVENFDIDVHRGLISLQNFGSDRQLVLHSDRSWLETNILREIFLLSHWLESINATYLILNLSKKLDINNVWGPSTFFLDYCKNLKTGILFENTYQSINNGINRPEDYDLYGWDGHHGPAGNRCYFEQSLLPKLKQLELC